jgi:molecular chaperone GrpE (heat shock protein)
MKKVERGCESKSKTRSQRRKQSQTDADGDTNSTSQFCRDGSSTESQPLRTVGANRSKRNQHQFGATATGGMLSESINELEDQLAEIDDEIQALQQKQARLRTRRDRFRQMFLDLEQRLQDES